jgi:uncharacterized protein YodC (DUF2158 family)
VANGPLNIGDVVKLKSGGPKMTVTRLLTKNGEPTCVCEWFEDETNKNAAAAFPVEALAKA